MPELAVALREWRQRLVLAGLSPAQLDELEDHVHCALAHHLEAGCTEVQALELALESLGSTAPLITEFQKVTPPMNPLSKLLGVGISLALVLFAAGAGSGLAVFFSAPSLLLVLGFVGGGLVASFGPVRILRALRFVAEEPGSVHPAERAELSEIAQRGYQLSWAGGALGVIAGVIQVLANLADPSLLGPGLALALLTLLYGALLAELLFGNLRQWCRVQLAATEH